VASPVATAGLIGRASELDALENALIRVADGAPQILILAGEAGIGKTRLIAEFTERAVARGAQVLQGACLDLAEGGLPYGPLTEALRGYLRHVPPERVDEILGPAREEIGRLLPGIGDAATRAKVPADADDDHAADTRSGLGQARLFGLLLGLLADLAAVAPVALVFEDLHWVDRSTRDLVTFLVRNLDRERLLLVLSVRTDDLAQGHPVVTWLAGLERDARTTRLDLPRLDRADVGRQVGILLGGRADEALVDRIHARSDGNPFFVEELVAAEQRGGSPSLPRTLAETLVSDIADLPDLSQRLLGIVAVAGRPIDEELIAAVAERAEPDVREPLRAAVSAGVLRPDPATGTLGLRHALLGEVVEARLLPAERRALHERFARVLSEQPRLAGSNPAGGAAELAHHWLAADRATEAFRASVAAAEAAERVYAFAAASQQYAVAIDLEARVAPDERADPALPDPIELRRRAARIADDAGETEQAIGWLREALERVDETADPATAGILHSRMGYSLWILDRNEEAQIEHREAVRLVPAAPPTAARAQALVGLGGWLMGAGRYGESRRACEEAVECAVAAGAVAEEGRARSNLGSDLVSLGEVAAGIRELEHARQIGEENGLIDTLLTASANLSYQLIVADRLDDAVAAATAGAEAVRSYGLERRFGPHFRASAIDALFRAGRWSEALALARDNVGRQRSGIGTIYRDAAVARLLGARGETGAARELLAEATQLGVGEIDADVGAFIQLVVAELDVDAGESDRAGDAVTAGLAHLATSDDTVLIGPLCATGLRAAADRAERARARRRPADVERAERVGASARERADALWSSAPSLGGSGLATRRTCEAEWGRLAGKTEAIAWTAAADAWAAIPMPYPAAYARFRAAEAHLVASERVAAEEALRGAARVSRELGARPLLTLIDGLAQRARVALEAPEVASAKAPRREADAEAPPAAVPRPFENLGLSVREIEVLSLVALGRTNGQIARELFISPKTASVHVTHILDKLGVSSRIEAAMLAARAGLTAADPNGGDGEGRAG
jgi:DNA-binding CsgD family transcriptional regulator/tetratricopeptide (TPR) repeat protein